jgi:hypothetical protein
MTLKHKKVLPFNGDFLDYEIARMVKNCEFWLTGWGWFWLDAATQEK